MHEVDDVVVVLADAMADGLVPRADGRQEDYHHDGHDDESLDPSRQPSRARPADRPPANGGPIAGQLRLSSRQPLPEAAVPGQMEDRGLPQRRAAASAEAPGRVVAFAALPADQ